MASVLAREVLTAFYPTPRGARPVELMLQQTPLQKTRGLDLGFANGRDTPEVLVSSFHFGTTAAVVAAASASASTAAATATLLLLLPLLLLLLRLLLGHVFDVFAKLQN